MEISNPKMKRSLESGVRRLNAAIILFFITGFLLVALQPVQNWSYQRILPVLVIPLLLYVNLNVVPKIFPVDRLLIAIVNFLCALGVLILYSTNAERGITQAVYYGLGTVFMLFCILLVRYVQNWDWFAFPVLVFSLAFLLAPILFGREINGAKNWIHIARVSIQPSEFVKISIIVISAYYMARCKNLVWMLFLALSMAILMLQKDLGAVLLYYTTVILMYFVANGSLRIILASMLAGAGSAVFAYYRFAHIQKRVRIWQNPWVDYENAGYQLVQSLVAIASGGLFGMGLGLGNPSVIPIYYTDFIFSVIAEQFGILFAALVLALYALLALRGAFIARSAQTRFHALLAIGCTVLLCFQTFVIIGGVMKLIPLTGVTMPFVSYGGSSLLASMGIAGLLQGVTCVNRDKLNDDALLTKLDHQGVSQ